MQLVNAGVAGGSTAAVVSPISQDFKLVVAHRSKAGAN